MILSRHWDSIQSKFQVCRPKDVGKNSGQTNKQTNTQTESGHTLKTIEVPTFSAQTGGWLDQWWVDQWER